MREIYCQTIGNVKKNVVRTKTLTMKEKHTLLKETPEKPHFWGTKFIHTLRTVLQTKISDETVCRALNNYNTVASKFKKSET